MRRANRRTTTTTCSTMVVMAATAAVAMMAMSSSSVLSSAASTTTSQQQQQRRELRGAQLNGRPATQPPPPVTTAPEPPKIDLTMGTTLKETREERRKRGKAVAAAKRQKEEEERQKKEEEERQKQAEIEKAKAQPPKTETEILQEKEANGGRMTGNGKYVKYEELSIGPKVYIPYDVLMLTKQTPVPPIFWFLQDEGFNTPSHKTNRQSLVKTYQNQFDEMKSTGESTWSSTSSYVGTLRPLSCLEVISQCTDAKKIYTQYEESFQFQPKAASTICRLMTLHMYGGYALDVDMGAVEPVVAPRDVMIAPGSFGSRREGGTPNMPRAKEDNSALLLAEMSSVMPGSSSSSSITPLQLVASSPGHPILAEVIYFLAMLAAKDELPLNNEMEVVHIVGELLATAYAKMTRDENEFHPYLPSTMVLRRVRYTKEMSDNDGGYGNGQLEFRDGGDNDMGCNDILVDAGDTSKVYFYGHYLGSPACSSSPASLGAGGEIEGKQVMVQEQQAQQQQQDTPAVMAPVVPYPQTIPKQLIFVHRYDIMNEIGWGDTRANIERTISSYSQAWGIEEEDDDNNKEEVYKFFDMKDCYELLLDLKEEQLAQYFEKEDRGEVRNAICRAAALYKYGGYYLDTTVEVSRPFLPQESTSFVAVEGCHGACFLPSFVASSAGHPILQADLNFMLSVYQEEDDKALLGPVTLKEAYHEVKNRGEVELLQEVSLKDEALSDLYPDIVRNEAAMVLGGGGENNKNGGACTRIVHDAVRRIVHFWISFGDYGGCTAPTSGKMLLRK